MEQLLRGIVEFRQQLLPQYADRFKELAHTQKPDTLFIACSDSRVVPNLFASTKPGELFVMRNVGNLMPPAQGSGHSVADESEAAAIEFSIGKLGVKEIVVCGHSNCGAMGATLKGEAPPGMPNLKAWLKHAQPALTSLREKGPLDSKRSEDDQLSQWNVLAQLDNIRTYPHVKERLGQGGVRLWGMWFDVGTGIVYAFDEEGGKFEEIGGEFAEKLLARFSQTAGS